jgi:hypothetical protein
MTAVLWIIHIATSRTHVSCTAKGYQNIRSIVVSLKKQLTEMGTAQGDSHPFVEVRHLVVLPSPGPNDGYSEGECGIKPFPFPKGWSENCEKNDHRGDDYCLGFALKMYKI